MRTTELIAKAQADLEKNGDREVALYTWDRSLYPNASYDVVILDGEKQSKFILTPGARRVV